MIPLFKDIATKLIKILGTAKQIAVFFIKKNDIFYRPRQQKQMLLTPPRPTATPPLQGRGAAGASQGMNKSI